MRLDQFLTEQMADMSRSRIKALIDQGQISSPTAKKISASAKVADGQQFLVSIPPVVAADPEPQNIALDVVFEDEHLLVLNKPAGLVVHPAAGNWDGTLVNALLHHCGDSLSGIGGVARPGIVHRLDKDTSGVMVVAKSDLAHRHLAGQFEAHSLERAYKAVVWGIPNPRENRIEGQIGRSPNNRKKMAVLEIGGKYAATNYCVERTLGRAASLLECRLETGRTHQIRVHMAEIGHSVVGDPVYGGSGRKKLALARPEVRDQILAFRQQALHAYLIGFTHPASHEFMQFTVDISSEINRLMVLLESV
ncbi:MAG: RluA family pseudouridine synthase [Rhodospirillales bacterium]|nr:RluA family pseudouridine synthase [Rhodospirillales bacterium]